MRSLPSSSDPSLSLSSRWHSVLLPAADTQKHPVAAATEQRSRWRISWGRLHTPSVLNALPLTPVPIFALLETGNGSCGFVCVAPTHASRSVKGDAAQSNIWSSICHSYTHTHTHTHNPNVHVSRLHQLCSVHHGREWLILVLGMRGTKCRSIRISCVPRVHSITLHKPEYTSA